MTPVFQSSKTDCLSAAIASVLDLPLSEVPSLWDLVGDAWLKALVEWAISRQLGFCYFNLKDRKEWPLLAGHYVIVGGSTKRSEEYLHAVVAKAEWDGKTTRLEYVHDPMVVGDFIDEPDHCIFFVK